MRNAKAWSWNHLQYLLQERHIQRPVSSVFSMVRFIMHIMNLIQQAVVMMNGIKSIVYFSLLYRIISLNMQRFFLAFQVNLVRNKDLSIRFILFQHWIFMAYHSKIRIRAQEIRRLYLSVLCICPLLLLVRVYLEYIRAHDTKISNAIVQKAWTQKTKKGREKGVVYNKLKKCWMRTKC